MKMTEIYEDDAIEIVASVIDQAQKEVLQEQPNKVLQEERKKVQQEERKEVLQEQPNKVLQEERKKVQQEERKKVQQEERKEVLQEQPKEVQQEERKEVLQEQPKEVQQEERKEIQQDHGLALEITPKSFVNGDEKSIFDAEIDSNLDDDMKSTLDDMKSTVDDSMKSNLDDDMTSNLDDDMKSTIDVEMLALNGDLKTNASQPDCDIAELKTCNSDDIFSPNVKDASEEKVATEIIDAAVDQTVAAKDAAVDQTVAATDNFVVEEAAEKDAAAALVSVLDDKQAIEVTTATTTAAITTAAAAETVETKALSPAEAPVFVDCPEALLEIQKIDLVDAIKNNRRQMRRSVSLTTNTATSHAPQPQPQLASAVATPGQVMLINGHVGMSPASPSASDGASSPGSTNGAVSPRNGATSPDSGINMEATAEIHNEGKTEKGQNGQNGQNGQADQTDGEKGLSEAEKERQEFIKSQIVRRRRSDVLPYTQALPTEERLAAEKQKTTEVLNSSQRKFSLVSKKNLWEKIVEEESVKAKQTYRPMKKPFGITRAMSLQANSSFLDPKDEVNKKQNLVKSSQNQQIQKLQQFQQKKQPQVQQQQQETHQNPQQEEQQQAEKTTIRKLSRNPAAMRFMSLDEESQQNSNLSNKRASITSTYTKAATAASPTDAPGGFQYRERESATDRIRKEIEEQKAREDELRTLGRIESLSEDAIDDLSVVSVSRCMSNDDDEEEEEEEEIERLEKERSFGTKISSPTRRASGGGGGIPTQL